jgi:hypothetical protein
MVLAALLGFAIGALAWWVLRPAPAPSSAPAADPAAGMDLPAVNAAALRFAGERRWNESLPYFRRQFVLLEQDVWAAHKDFAAALHNAAAEGGSDGPATRSSFERIALLRESLAELDMATALTGVPAERALLVADRAHTLWFWGMPWDALHSIDEGAPAGAPQADLVRRARLYRAVMERPDDPALRGRG